MEVTPLRSLIEAAVARSAPDKRLSGTVLSPEQLLDEVNVRHLEQAHSGVFAFLAFEMAVDVPIRDYVLSGTLGADSGPHILVLFALGDDLPSSDATYMAGGVVVDATVHPAYDVIRRLFQPKPPPPLPGIAFMARLSSPTDTVYVDLDGMGGESAARSRLRLLFSLADGAFDVTGDRSQFADSFAVGLARRGVNYSRSGRRALREWLVWAYRFLLQNRSDVVAVLGDLP